jgi:hypothetical protein
VIDQEHAADPAACTEVLATVPQPVADRIAAFLHANGVACAVRPVAQGGGTDEAGSASRWEVLVRPEDLPADKPAAEPKAEPAAEPKLNVLPVDEGAAEPAPGSPVALCELPWEQAWALSRRLIEAGIPAAVMEPEKHDREQPMAARIVPVGVRPEDVERARAVMG